MKKIIITYFCAFIYVLAAGNGSPYSIVGFGEYAQNFNSRIYGLGGLGYAWADKFSLNGINPASNANLLIPRLEGSILYTGLNLKDNNSTFYSNANVNGIVLGVPLERDFGLSITTGFLPQTNIKNTYRDKYFKNGYKFEFENNGGLSKYFLSIASSFNSNYSFGVSLDYLIFDKNQMSRVYNEDYNLTNAEYKTNYHFNHINYTLGFIAYKLNEYLNIKELKDLRFGATFSPEFTKSADTIVNLRTFRGEQIGSDYSQSIEISKGKLDYKKPLEYGIGLSAYFDEYTIGFDYRFINTKKMLNKQNKLNDYQKIAIYLEYQKEKPRSYWQAIPLRFALSYEKTPYTIDNKDVNAISFYSGASLPLSKESSIDIGISYGLRGSNTKLKEQIINFNVGFGFSEIWFIREEK